MAVMMIMDAPEGTTEEYDRTNEIMGLSGDEDAPEGLIQHVAATDGKGLLIVDLWESEDAFGRFYEQRLGPALEQSGVASSAGEPRPGLPVHSAFQGAGTEPNVVLVMDMDNLTTDNYDQMVAGMPAHLAQGKDHPAVSHTAAKSESGGMVIVDVWDSPESFGKFAEESIGPMAADVGMAPPQPRVLQLHNRIRGRARVS